MLASLRIDVRLQALRANLFHHALHRRVDRADREVMRIQVIRKYAVSCRGDRGHHPVGTDGNKPVTITERYALIAELALSVRLHGLNDMVLAASELG